MKKINIAILVILVCALLAFTFTACNKDSGALVTVVYGEGTGTYAVGSQVTIKASVPADKVFIGWRSNEKIISKDNPYTFTVEEDVAFIAVFSEDTVQYTVTVEGGTGSGIYADGTKVQALATVPDGYRFVRWTDGTNEISTNNPYKFTARSDRKLVAVIEKISIEDEFQNYTATVYKAQGEDFVILNLTDIQLHNGQSTDETFAIIEELITSTNPDLIVTLGDLINDSPTYGSKTNAKAIMDKIDSYDIPWALIFGNHDFTEYGTSYVSKKDWDAADIAEYAQSLDNCLYLNGPSTVSHLSNYIINVVEEGTNEIVETLIMLDSGINGLDETHTAFYRDAISYVTSLNDGNTVDSIVYTHIPLPEYGDAYEISKANQFADCIGAIHRSGSDLATGTKTMFTAIKELGSTKNVICGHDHENACIYNYQGITLTYCMKSGDGDYIKNGEYWPQPQFGGTTFTIYDNGDPVAVNMEKSKTVRQEIVNKTQATINMDSIAQWQYSGATVSFDFKLTNTVNTGNNIKFSFLGTNIKNTTIKESDRYGEWNRLTSYITINASTLVANYGTITPLGDGVYHYSLRLLDAPLNTQSGEVSDGSETIKIAYFSEIQRSFEISNFFIDYEEYVSGNRKDLSTAVVTAIPDQYYDGLYKTPGLTITVDGTPINPKEDYKVVYTNNIYKGTATVTITPSGYAVDKYYGQKVVTFSIIDNPDEDTNNDHINATMITATQEFGNAELNVANFANSGKTLAFDFKKLTVTAPQNGNTVKISLMDSSWKRLNKYFYLDLSSYQVTCNDVAIGTVTNIGDGWYHFEIALSDVPLNTSEGAVASDTLDFIYIDNVLNAFKIDNLEVK